MSVFCRSLRAARDNDHREEIYGYAGVAFVKLADLKHIADIVVLTGASVAGLSGVWLRVLVAAGFVVLGVVELRRNRA